MSDIELVVKIAEVEYEHLTNKEKFYSLEKNKQEWLINKILNRVIDATPLPKGHGRLIDTDAIQVIELEDSLNFMQHIKGDEVNVYIDAPTVIEADKVESEG